MTEAAMSQAYKQILRAKSEVETSLVSARSLRDQWIAANNPESSTLTKREVDHIGKSLKNRLLTVKWDCEDLEDLLIASENELLNSGEDPTTIRRFIEQSKIETNELIKLLEDTDAKTKVLAKHGINVSRNQQLVMPALIQSNGTSRYGRLTNNDAEEVQFDKNQVQGATNQTATIYDNALYDYLEEVDFNPQINKSFNTSQVFSNLSRPETNVYMNSNENEIILDMLETEYYNPPNGLRASSQFNYAFRKLLETDRNKLLGTVAFLFSFPILLVIFLVA